MNTVIELNTADMTEFDIQDWAISAFTEYRRNPETFKYQDFEKEWFPYAKMNDRSKIHALFLKLDKRVK